MRTLLLALGLSLPLGTTTAPQERVPGEHWLRYADPAEAGFDAERLASARATWESLPSSAFLVVADGAVVAGWGDLERRFMCHSVRKSFMAALYGIYWDRGELELNKRLSDLGVDDEPDPLLDTEKEARILDLLKARSGVFHPAAYAGRTDSRPRGSEGPGRFFAYNNWDFNTLATILMNEVGDDVFEAFDEHFARPLGMQDWRVSDGYYHYERDKSRYPAYPFRMSARDAARFGLLFARLGAWGDERILSKHWVRRSTSLYSIDDEVMGYGFMWWVFREPRFERHGMVSALGVGNQMIAALPESDLVIVNRANTYEGEGTPTGPLLDLIETVLAARTGEPVADPRLVPLEPSGEPLATVEPDYALEALAGSWSVPPASFGLPPRMAVTVAIEDGVARLHTPVRGTFALFPQGDGSLLLEDSLDRVFVLRDDAGAVTGLADVQALAEGALVAAADEEPERSAAFLERLEAADPGQTELTRAMIDALLGEFDAAAEQVRVLARRPGAPNLENRINSAGYGLLQGRPDCALAVFELNTLAFPRSANVWDSLAEAHFALGHHDEAIEFYTMSLELDPGNANARTMIGRVQEASAGSE